MIHEGMENGVLCILSDADKLITHLVSHQKTRAQRNK